MFFAKYPAACGLRQALARRVCTGKSKRPVTVPSDADRSLSNKHLRFRTSEPPATGRATADRSPPFPTATDEEAARSASRTCADLRRLLAPACGRMARSATGARRPPQGWRFRQAPWHPARDTRAVRSAMVEIPDARTGSPQPIACDADRFGRAPAGPPLGQPGNVVAVVEAAARVGGIGFGANPSPADIGIERLRPDAEELQGLLGGQPFHEIAASCGFYVDRLRQD